MLKECAGLFKRRNRYSANTSFIQHLQESGCDHRALAKKELQEAFKPSVTDKQAGTARPIFIQPFFKIFQKGNTKLSQQSAPGLNYS